MNLARALTVAAALAAVAPHAHAGEPGPSAAADPKAAARALYLEGVGFVQKAQWSEALAAFEASAKLFPNASTTFNMGACERAMGRYVRARATIARALAESAAAGNALPDSTVTEARGFIAEIDRLLAHVQVSVDPPEAAIAVDGRPLSVQREGDRTWLAAGVLPPGAGSPPPSKSFELLLDPGAHVITLSRKGFTDAVVNRSFAPGSTSTLDLKLDLLPATLKISSSQPSALVKVNDADVGPVPVDVLRPAGAYKVSVRKEGYLPYASQVTVQPGEEVKLRAQLAEDKPTIVQRWWFWTGIAAVVAGGVVITVVATRPKAQPPDYDGGSTNWVVTPSALKF